MRKKIVLIIIGVIILCLVACGLYYFFVLRLKTGDIFCTMDAKLCPDGSYVGRTPPFCRFKDCPEVTDPTADPSADEAGWKTYRNEEYGFEMKYPEGWTEEIRDAEYWCQKGEGYNRICYFAISFWSLDKKDGLTIVIFGDPKKAELEDWLSREAIRPPQCNVWDSVKISEIVGSRATCTNGHKAEMFYFKNGDFIFDVSASIENQSKILSTFKFID